MHFYLILLLFFFLAWIGIFYLWENKHKDLSFPNVIPKEKIITPVRKKRKKTERTVRKDLYYPPVYPPIYPSEPLGEKKDIPNDPIDFPPVTRIKRIFRNSREEFEVDVIDPPIKKTRDVGTNTDFIEVVPVIPEKETKEASTKTRKVKKKEIGTDPLRERIASIELSMIDHRHERNSEEDHPNYLEQGHTIETEYVNASKFHSRSHHSAEVIAFPEIPLALPQRTEPFFNLLVIKEVGTNEENKSLSRIKGSDLKQIMGEEAFEQMEESFKSGIKSVNLGHLEEKINESYELMEALPRIRVRSVDLGLEEEKQVEKKKSPSPMSSFEEIS